MKYKINWLRVEFNLNGLHGVATDLMYNELRCLWAAKNK